MESICPTIALSVDYINCTESISNPTSSIASRTTFASILLDFIDSLPPLNITEFPDFRQSTDISIVTLGRLSYIAPITPNGTLLLPICKPFGKVLTYGDYTNLSKLIRVEVTDAVKEKSTSPKLDKNVGKIAINAKNIEAGNVTFVKILSI